MLQVIYNAMFESLDADHIYSKLMAIGKLLNANCILDQSIPNHPNIDKLKDKLAKNIMSFPVGNGRYSWRYYSEHYFGAIREQFILKDSSIRELMNLSHEFNYNLSHGSNLYKLKFLWDHFTIAKILSGMKSGGKMLFEQPEVDCEIDVQAVCDAFASYMGIEYSKIMCLIRALSDENNDCDESRKILTKWIRQTLAAYEDLFYYLYCAPWINIFTSHPSTEHINFEYDNVFVVHAYDNNFGIKWGQSLHETNPGIVVHVKMPQYFAGVKYMDKYFIVTPQCSHGKYGFLSFENIDERDKAITAVCDFFAHFVAAMDRLKDIFSLKTKLSFRGNPTILSVIWNNINGSQVLEEVDAKISIRFLRDLPSMIEINIRDGKQYNREQKAFAVAVVKQLLASFFIEGLMRYYLKCFNYIETCSNLFQAE